MQAEQFGRYTLLSRLGYGGIAEVFMARTSGIGGFEKTLAIKRLLPHCVSDQHTVDLLADEARITVQLTHPNIMQVFDFGRVDNSYYLAMEYIDGVDLKTLVEIDHEKSEPLPEQLACHILAAVLDGLAFAHNRRDREGNPLGIIHRDVTPHNVMISTEGQVKLTDFGVARARISSHVSVIGDIRGKFSYMPPEQAVGGEIDQRVDLFAVGAMFYELVCGRQPFRSESTGEQIVLLNRAVPPPSTHLSTVSAEADRIAAKALQNNPDARYSTAEEFATDLRKLFRKIQADELQTAEMLRRMVASAIARRETSGVRAQPELTMGIADYQRGDESLIDEDEATAYAPAGSEGPTAYVGIPDATRISFAETDEEEVQGEPTRATLADDPVVQAVRAAQNTVAKHDAAHNDADDDGEEATVFVKRDAAKPLPVTDLFKSATPRPQSNAPRRRSNSDVITLVDDLKDSGRHPSISGEIANVLFEDGKASTTGKIPLDAGALSSPNIHDTLDDPSDTHATNRYQAHTESEPASGEEAIDLIDRPFLASEHQQTRPWGRSPSPKQLKLIIGVTAAVGLAIGLWLALS